MISCPGVSYVLVIVVTCAKSFKFLWQCSPLFPLSLYDYMQIILVFIVWHGFNIVLLRLQLPVVNIHYIHI